MGGYVGGAYEQGKKLVLKEQLESRDTANVVAEHPFTMFGGANLVRAQGARTRKQRALVIRGTQY